MEDKRERYDWRQLLAELQLGQSLLIKDSSAAQSFVRRLNQTFGAGAGSVRTTNVGFRVRRNK